MITAIAIGGAITAACETCGARPSAICLSPQGAPCKKPHAARVRHATPEQTVSVGALLDVRLASGVRLAQLHAIPDETTLLVRVWSPSAQAFSAPKAIRRAEAIRLAGDNARTRIAREQLRLEAERAATPVVDRLATDVLEGRGPFDPGLLDDRPHDRPRDDRPPRDDEEVLDDKGRPMGGQAMSAPAHGAVHKVSDSWFDDSAGTTKPAPKGW